MKEQTFKYLYIKPTYRDNRPTAILGGEVLKVYQTKMKACCNKYYIKNINWHPQEQVVDIKGVTYSDTLHWQTLHQFLTITDLDLITEFDFLPNCARFL